MHCHIHNLPKVTFLYILSSHNLFPPPPDLIFTFSFAVCSSTRLNRILSLKLLERENVDIHGSLVHCFDFYFILLQQSSTLLFFSTHYYSIIKFSDFISYNKEANYYFYFCFLLHYFGLGMLSALIIWEVTAVKHLNTVSVSIVQNVDSFHVRQS